MSCGRSGIRMVVRCRSRAKAGSFIADGAAAEDALEERRDLGEGNNADLGFFEGAADAYGGGVLQEAAEDAIELGAEGELGALERTDGGDETGIDGALCGIPDVVEAPGAVDVGTAVEIAEARELEGVAFEAEVGVADAAGDGLAELDVHERIQRCEGGERLEIGFGDEQVRLAEGAVWGGDVAADKQPAADASGRFGEVGRGCGEDLRELQPPGVGGEMHKRLVLVPGEA